MATVGCQLCSNSTEAIELYESKALYLKPIAKLNISVTLPQLKTPGKSISNWEVMEKLKKMAKPDSFLVLRVTKSSLEFLRFEAEIEARSLIKVMITRLDNQNIKLSGFTETMKVRAAEAKIPFPSRHDWDAFFRDAKNMNEQVPGERPDTIHVENLPVRWFAIDVEPDKPSEIVVRNVFGTCGVIRNIDIPMLDPYRHESQITGGNFGKISSLGSNLTFDVYVQFTEYIGFVKAMDTFKGMKLMRMGQEGNAYTAEIKVDFDKTKHLSAKAIKKREKERQKLMELIQKREEQKKKEKEEEEWKKEEERKKKEEEEKLRHLQKQMKETLKRNRRQQREERRRQRREERRLQRKIQMEERKLVLAQRKLESIRLLTILLEKVKAVRQEEEVAQKLYELEKARQEQLEKEKAKKEAEERKKKRAEAKKAKKLKHKEKKLRSKLLKTLQTKEEKYQEEKRESLRKKLTGKTRLRSTVVTAPSTSSQQSGPSPEEAAYAYAFQAQVFSPEALQRLEEYHRSLAIYQRQLAVYHRKMATHPYYRHRYQQQQQRRFGAYRSPYGTFQMKQHQRYQQRDDGRGRRRRRSSSRSRSRSRTRSRSRSRTRSRSRSRYHNEHDDRDRSSRSSSRESHSRRRSSRSSKRRDRDRDSSRSSSRGFDRRRSSRSASRDSDHHRRRYHSSSRSSSRGRNSDRRRQDHSSSRSSSRSKSRGRSRDRHRRDRSSSRSASRSKRSKGERSYTRSSSRGSDHRKRRKRSSSRSLSRERYEKHHRRDKSSRSASREKDDGNHGNKEHSSKSSSKGRHSIDNNEAERSQRIPSKGRHKDEYISSTSKDKNGDCNGEATSVPHTSNKVENYVQECSPSSSKLEQNTVYEEGLEEITSQSSEGRPDEMEEEDGDEHSHGQHSCHGSLEEVSLDSSEKGMHEGINEECNGKEEAEQVNKLLDEGVGEVCKGDEEECNMVEQTAESCADDDNDIDDDDDDDDDDDESADEVDEAVTEDGKEPAF